MYLPFILPLSLFSFFRSACFHISVLVLPRLRYYFSFVWLALWWEVSALFWATGTCLINRGGQEIGTSNDVKGEKFNLQRLLGCFLAVVLYSLTREENNLKEWFATNAGEGMRVFVASKQSSKWDPQSVGTQRVAPHPEPRGDDLLNPTLVLLYPSSASCCLHLAG